MGPLAQGFLQLSGLEKEQGDGAKEKVVEERWARVSASLVYTLSLQLCPIPFPLLRVGGGRQVGGQRWSSPANLLPEATASVRLMNDPASNE